MSTAKKLCSASSGILAAAICTLPWLLWGDVIRQYTNLGYGGLFLSCLLINAVVLLPASSTVCVVAAASILNPWLCVLVAGLGAALGEAVAYLCGFLSHFSIRDAGRIDRFSRWIEKRSFLSIFVYAVLPLPFFDVLGIAAGIRRIPLWKFMTAAILGKCIKYIVAVCTALFFLPWLTQYLSGYAEFLSQFLQNTVDLSSTP